MKKNMKSLGVLLISMLLFAPAFTSCKDMLEEENFGSPTVEDMMANEENVILLVGQAYADIKWLHDHWGYWGVASLTSDECLCPVRLPGEHWSDGGYWKNLNTHKWNEFADAFRNIWNSTISGAVLCNKLLKTLKDNSAKMDPVVYDQYVGELEILRSYYYYMLFDCFGRIPYLEEFADVTEPLMEPQCVWAYLVTCLEKNAPNLPQVSDANRATNYGRVSQGFAYTLLARLYLNAESYGCTIENLNKTYEKGKETIKPIDILTTQKIKIATPADFYTNAVRCCDAVINSGSYSIESNYFDNFKIQNENSRENIFVIVEDGNASFDLRYNGSMMNKLRMIQLTLHYCHQKTWNMIEKPWNGFCARPQYMALFDKEDVRGAGNEGLGTECVHQWGWFVGPVKDKAGKQLKDENDSLAIIVPTITSLDGASWNDGARLWKYEVDKSKKYDWGENDFVLLRYADVLWMKEEAILRGGTGASGYNTPDFKTLRSRAFAYSANPSAAYEIAYPAALTLEGILNERGREFSWECVRRRDLIRFDKYKDVQYVTSKDAYRNWFPIPYSVLEKGKRDEKGNPIWTQNEGYN